MVRCGLMCPMLLMMKAVKTKSSEIMGKGVAVRTISGEEREREGRASLRHFGKRRKKQNSVFDIKVKTIEMGFYLRKNTQTSSHTFTFDIINFRLLEQTLNIG